MHTVAVRLTPTEHQAWLDAATKSGRGQLGRWVRETVTARLEGRKDVVPVEGANEVRAELSRVGSNLNQIAKALNVAARGGGPKPELQTVIAVLSETKKTMAEIRDRLSP